MNKYDSAWYQKSLTNLTLHGILNAGPLENFAKEPGISLVVFKVIKNKGDLVLIYNYLTYSEIFTNSLITYLIIKGNFAKSETFMEWGDIFTIIDKNIDTHPNVTWIKERCYEYNEYLKQYLAWAPDNFLNNYYELFDVAKKYVLVTDNDLISCLVSSAYERDYCQFFSKAFYDFNMDYSIFEANTPTKDLCLLKSCLFVVKDKDLLIENLNKIFKGNKLFGVNQGPKKLRGQANSLKNLLFDIDKDFRKSLFDQIKYHKNKGNLNSFNFEIAWRNYNPENVHKKLGVREL